MLETAEMHVLDAELAVEDHQAGEGLHDAGPRRIPGFFLGEALPG